MSNFRMKCDIILDESEIEEIGKLKNDMIKISKKLKNTDKEKSSIRYHTCRHDEGLPCIDEVVIK